MLSLVLLGWRHCCPYTCNLSTSCSPRDRQISHLEVGFPLRCFQWLSRPNIATQRMCQ